MIIAGWLIVSLVVFPLTAYFFFTMAYVVIGGTVKTPSFSEPVQYTTETEVARFGNELELGFSTSVSCRGYSYPTGEPGDYCYVGPKFTVYQAYQLKDTLNLQENPGCTMGTIFPDYFHYCGGVEYLGFHHDVAIWMPYDTLFNYYIYGMLMAGVGVGIVLLARQKRSSLAKSQDVHGNDNDA
jgi:hypothetical protein